jgi:hypothetical protein
MSNSFTALRSAIVSTGPLTHLDHLAPLSYFFNIPLIVTDRTAFEEGKKFYPDALLSFKDLSDLDLNFLATHLDALFTCGKFWNIELKSKLELFYQKRLRIIHVPHGNSDKGRHDRDPPPQDIAYVYGEHMRTLLKQNGAISKIKKIISMGNIRLQFYQEKKAFYDQWMEQTVIEKNKAQQPIILYAPSWELNQSVGDFFSQLEQLIRLLTPTFFLIVKLHPFIEEHYPAHFHHFVGRYSPFPSLLFLQDFPLIYPLLAKCDIYLGNHSSIAYDFLAFQKPLYFTAPPSQTLIEQCGAHLPKNQNPLSWIEQKLKEDSVYIDKRQKLYSHVFDPLDLKNLWKETLEELRS